MAASMRGIGRILSRISPLISHSVQHNEKLPARLLLWTRTGAPSVLPSHPLCTTAARDGDAEVVVRYKDRPWDYLESEEYIERYGANPVWTGYRRNHKGSVPPQKTRKKCIRGDTLCSNACPICRDPNIILHHQVSLFSPASGTISSNFPKLGESNVKLLEQFISPYTGLLYDPTQTGVCMQQQKRLHLVVNQARDHGFLPFEIPHVEFTEDYSNKHQAVGSTPPPPCLDSGEPWYKWYGTIEPAETELAKVKKMYRAYLKK